MELGFPVDWLKCGVLSAALELNMAILMGNTMIVGVALFSDKPMYKPRVSLYELTTHRIFMDLSLSSLSTARGKRTDVCKVRV